MIGIKIIDFGVAMLFMGITYTFVVGVFGMCSLAIEQFKEGSYLWSALTTGAILLTIAIIAIILGSLVLALQRGAIAAT